MEKSDVIFGQTRVRPVHADDASLSNGTLEGLSVCWCEKGHFFSVNDGRRLLNAKDQDPYLVDCDHVWFTDCHVQAGQPPRSLGETIRQFKTNVRKHIEKYRAKHIFKHVESIKRNAALHAPVASLLSSIRHPRTLLLSQNWLKAQIKDVK